MAACHRFIIVTIGIFLALSMIGITRGEWDTFHGDPARTGYMDADFIAGDILWERDLGNGYIDTSPIMAGDRVFVISAGDAGADSTVHCLDAETGDSVWNTTIPGKTYQLSTPVFANARLYFGSSSGVFYCLAADDGDIQWQHLLDPSFNGITSSPAFDEPSGNLYVGTGDGTLYNLDTGTGNTIWSYNTGASIYFSSPAVYGDLVIVGNDAGNLFGVRDGNEVWRYETGDRIRSSACIHENGTIFFAGEDGMLRSLTPGGEPNWEVQVGRSISTPALHNGRVYIGSEGGLHAVFLNGTIEFTIPTRDPVESSPAVSEHQLFFSTNANTGELMAADLSGKVIWSYPLEDYSLSSPGFLGSTLCTASDNGRVWCFHSTEPGSVHLEVDPLPEFEAGEQTLTFSGTVHYDTGRPASGVEIEIDLLDRSATGRSGANGSYAVNLTMDLIPGNHTAFILASDGELSDETNVSVLVLEGSSEGAGSGDSNEFISGFESSGVIVGISFSFLIFRRYGKFLLKK